MNRPHWVPGRRFGSLTLTIGPLVVVAVALAGCAQVTALDSQEQVGSYSVTTTIDPKTINPPQYGTLAYTVADATSGKAVTQFQPTSGALLQNVLISRDLEHFWHSYTQQLSNDTAAVSAYFPIFSKYYSYAQFTPLGASLKTVTSTITTGSKDGTPPDLVPDSTAVKSVGWLTFALAPTSGEIKAGTPTQLVVQVRERGYPVTALWPNLGAPAHIWIVDENGDNFAHEVASSEAHSYAATPGAQATATPILSISGGATITPTVTLPPPPTFAPAVVPALTAAASFTPAPVPPVQQTAQASVMTTPEVLPGIGYGPNLAFTHTFPHPGKYKFWVEVLYRSTIVTTNYNDVTIVSYVVNVVP